MVLGVKNPPANAGDIRDADSIPGSGRSPGGGHGNPLQYSYLENPRDRGAWQATVYGVARVGHYLATKPPLYHKIKKVKVAQSCPILFNPIDYIYSPWNSPG